MAQSQANGVRDPATLLPPLLTEPADNPFADGQPLKGRYVVGARLGQHLVNGVAESAGAIGLAYLASDKDNFNQKFVVKTLRAQYLNDNYARQQFAKEREALARLNGNDDIVRLADSGEKDGRPFIIVEYVDGKMLSALLAAGPMEFARAANLLRRIARALHKAHQAGVFHRDLKPDNLMVIKDTGEPEKIKLLDFGLAKIKKSMVSPDGLVGSIVGTPQYAAPEQLTPTPNDQLNEGLDIYALGVVAYEMLTGQRPFQAAGDVIALQRAKAAADFTLPQELRPDLPAAAQVAILKALAPDAADRYASMPEFGNALAEALAQPSSAVVPSVTAKPPARRGRWWLAFVLLLVFVAGLSGLWQFFPQRASPVVVRELLEYSLTLQPMRNNAPAGTEFTTADSKKLATGWRYQINAGQRRDGAFYLLTENGPHEVRIIVPVNQSAHIAAGSRVNSGWRVFGGERIWLVWAAQPVTALENAPRNQTGAVTDPPQAAAVLEFLNTHRAPNRVTLTDGKATLVSAEETLAYQLPGV